MKSLPTLPVLAVQIFVMGAITIFNEQLVATGTIDKITLITISQITFAALVMDSVMKYTDEYRVSAGIPPMTEEYSPPEILRVLFQMSLAFFIGSGWAILQFNGELLVSVLVFMMTVAGGMIVLGLRAVEGVFQATLRFIFAMETLPTVAPISTQQEAG